VEDRIQSLLRVDGRRPVDAYHREMNIVMCKRCGMARDASGLKKALGEIRVLRDAFWSDVKVPGAGDDINQELEKAVRVADFLELAELITRDALARNESCGGHFREEYQTEEGEALRDNENFQHVAVWEYAGEDSDPVRHIEPLVFERVTPTQRSYK